MEIRNYQDKDYEQVKKLLISRDLFDESYDTEKKFECKKPEGSIIVAEDEDKIVGFVLFTYDGWDSSIYRLAVDLSYEGKGLGLKLMGEAEKRLKNLGADVVQAGIHVENERVLVVAEKFGYGGNWGPYIWKEKKL